MPAWAPVGEAQLFEPCLKVPRADRTGLRLPEHLTDAVPGAGGRATTAGANMHRVWEEKPSLWAPFVVRPWQIPENT
jgi:hypothetical protein